MIEAKQFSKEELEEKIKLILDLKLNNKSLSLHSLSSQFNISKPLITMSIKKLGYVWNNSLKSYEKKIIVKKNKPEILGFYRCSGHLLDQYLKTCSSYNPKSLLLHYGKLKKKTKEEVEFFESTTGTKIYLVYLFEGIKLSPSEKKVVDCICKLLHEKSQTKLSGDDNYYSGQTWSKDRSFGDFGGIGNICPGLSFTLHELAKDFNGGKRVGGKDIKNLNQILVNLAEKKFLLSYTEISSCKKLRIKVEEFSPLIRLLNVQEDSYDSNNIKRGTKKEVEIILNPIFRSQISSKFVLCPNDLVKRTIEAYGSSKLTSFLLKFRDYLIRELSNKRFNPEINELKFYEFLSPNLIRKGRLSKIKEDFQKASEALKKMGLLVDVILVEGNRGQSKFKFILNKHWNKSL